jgi:[acyl-carrier-protein] S-malonyltransferase
LMSQAAERMRERLEEVTLGTPKIPLLHNVDVQQHEDPGVIKEVLTRQLFSPVRWAEIVGFCADAGVAYMAECGPGKILSGLNKRISPNLQSLALADGAAIRNANSILSQVE